MGEVFKWYFVVPEGWSEGVWRGVRKALEMPFFASPGNHNIDHTREARRLHSDAKRRMLHIAERRRSNASSVKAERKKW